MNGILGYDTFLGRAINKTIDYIFLFFLWKNGTKAVFGVREEHFHEEKF